jgi:hypothetical protein
MRAVLSTLSEAILVCHARHYVFCTLNRNQVSSRNQIYFRTIATIPSVRARWTNFIHHWQKTAPLPRHDLVVGHAIGRATECKSSHFVCPSSARGFSSPLMPRAFIFKHTIIICCPGDSKLDRSHRHVNKEVPGSQARRMDELAALFSRRFAVTPAKY